MSLTWTPLAPFGADVDLDLSQGIAGEVVGGLVELFETQHLLLFRSQALSNEDQEAITEWFGPLLPGDGSTTLAPDPELGALGAGRLAYHCDLSCTPHPLLGLSLRAVDVCDGATSTVFVDAVQAAATLPRDLLDRVDGLHARNLWPTSLADRQRNWTVPADWPGTDHPVLMAHPRFDAVHLSVNENQTDRIVELEPDESEKLIQALFAHLYSGAFSYEHRWNGGDFIVWDNRALQHGRPAIPEGMPRTLHRVELGAFGYAQLMPPQVVEAYSAPG